MNYLSNLKGVFFLTLWTSFSFYLLLAKDAHAEDVSIEVASVPGHEILLVDLKERGYSTNLKKFNHPVNGFNVISIGSSVPLADAFEIVRLAKNRIQSIKFIVLAGDLKKSTSNNSVVIGASNRIMHQFPEAKPISSGEFADLIGGSFSRPDLFYQSVRETYYPKESSSTLHKSEVILRNDGVMLVPDSKGGTRLYASNGRKGAVLEGIGEVFQSADLAPLVVPARGGHSSRQWEQKIREWLRKLNDRLLSDLRLLLPGKYYTNYVDFENSKAKNSITDQVNLRREYLSKVIDHMYNQP